jgi:phage-related holin
MWERISDGWQFKVAITMVFNQLFGEYNAAMGALGILVVLDWLTKWWALSKSVGGFWIAWRTDVISSRGMRDGLSKIFWYIVLLIAAHQLESFRILGYVLGSAPKELLSSYLALIETKSLLENLRDTGMKGIDPLINLFSKKQNQIAENKEAK